MRELTVLLFGLSLALGAQAATVEGVTYPEKIEVNGKALVLNGMALYETTFLKVDVYVGGLYVEEATQDASAILDRGRIKHLVQTYKIYAGKKRIQSTFVGLLEDAAGPDKAALKEVIQTYVSLFGDIKKGDVFTYTFVPMEGLTVHQNKKKLGHIPDGPFCRLLFEIWVGAPAEPQLRKGYLKGGK
jgi:hypothetical protein